MAAHVLVWVCIAFTVLGVGAVLQRPHERRIEPPKLIHIIPATLAQAIRNREKIDDYFLRIREEQHMLRQKLDRADLDSSEAKDTFNVFSIEQMALRTQRKRRG